jgi:hypothetical protein
VLVIITTEMSGAVKSPECWWSKPTPHLVGQTGGCNRIIRSSRHDLSTEVLFSRLSPEFTVKASQIYRSPKSNISITAWSIDICILPLAITVFGYAHFVSVQQPLLHRQVKVLIYIDAEKMKQGAQ